MKIQLKGKALKVFKWLNFKLSKKEKSKDIIQIKGGLGIKVDSHQLRIVSFDKLGIEIEDGFYQLKGKLLIKIDSENYSNYSDVNYLLKELNRNIDTTHELVIKDKLFSPQGIFTKIICEFNKRVPTQTFDPIQLMKLIEGTIEVFEPVGISVYIGKEEDRPVIFSDSSNFWNKGEFTFVGILMPIYI